MLSSINADGNSNSRIANYHKIKAFADRNLMDSDLGWMFVSPGGSRDEEGGKGMVSVSKETFMEGVTTRDNLNCKF